MSKELDFYPEIPSDSTEGYIPIEHPAASYPETNYAPDEAYFSAELLPNEPTGDSAVISDDDLLLQVVPTSVDVQEVPKFPTRLEPAADDREPPPVPGEAASRSPIMAKTVLVDHGSVDSASTPVTDLPSLVEPAHSIPAPAADSRTHVESRAESADPPVSLAGGSDIIKPPGPPAPPAPMPDKEPDRPPAEAVEPQSFKPGQARVVEPPKLENTQSPTDLIHPEHLHKEDPGDQDPDAPPSVETTAWYNNYLTDFLEFPLPPEYQGELSSNQAIQLIRKFQKETFAKLQATIGLPLDERITRVVKASEKMGLPTAPVLIMHTDKASLAAFSHFDRGRLERELNNDPRASGIFCSDLNIGVVFADNLFGNPIKTVSIAIHEVWHGSQGQAYEYNNATPGRFVFAADRHDVITHTTLRTEARAHLGTALQLATVLKHPFSVSHFNRGGVRIPPHYEFWEDDPYTYGAMALELLVVRNREPDRKLFRALIRGPSSRAGEEALDDQFVAIERILRIPRMSDLMMGKPDDAAYAYSQFEGIKNTFFIREFEPQIRAAKVCEALMGEMLAGRL